MMSNIEKIYNDFRENFENNSDFVIDFYTKNSVLLNNIKSFKNKEELQLFIEITWQYLNAIYGKDRFNEAIDFADRNLTLIDSEISKLDANEVKDDWYNGILLFKGMSSYRLRDYKTSTPIFKYLVNSDPKNDNFKNWLNYSSYGQKYWLVNTINIVCGLMVAGEILFRDYIESFELRIFILGLGMLGLLGNWGYEYYIKRSFRKVNKN